MQTPALARLAPLKQSASLPYSPFPSPRAFKPRMEATNATNAAAQDCSSFKVQCAADAKCADGTPCAHAGGGAAGTVEPKRTHETDLLVFDVYAKNITPLDFLETQVRAVVIPHVSWCEKFLRMENDPTTGVNRLRVSCLLKDSDETTMNKVEESLGSLQYGNRAGVSSVYFRGYMAC